MASLKDKEIHIEHNSVMDINSVKENNGHKLDFKWTKQTSIAKQNNGNNRENKLYLTHPEMIKQ